MFNGLMQIPGREHRRQALREIRAACRPGARFLFTTHDRDDGPHERLRWAAEAGCWARGEQDPRLLEFGDRYFDNDHGGHTFMHLPLRAEVFEDLAVTGWVPLFDAMRRTVTPESATVREFADECRFWLAQKGVEAVRKLPGFGGRRTVAASFLRGADSAAPSTGKRNGVCDSFWPPHGVLF